MIQRDEASLNPHSARAHAPASLGNLAVGFDVLGQAFGALHDSVTAHREAEHGVRLGTVSGRVTSLPSEPAQNTALAAAQAVMEAAGAGFGVRLDIDKQIPLSAGLGGSGASAVAGAAAVNALLPVPFATADLLEFALVGEAVSSDPPAWDNVMSSLLGGLVMAADTRSGRVVRLPVPQGIVSIVCHPDVGIETRTARGLLAASVPLATAVEQTRRISAFTLGCATNDIALIRSGLEDLLVEPQRARLLNGFYDIKSAALAAGALGCSFSGSGPSMFAWALEADGDSVRAAMEAAFSASGHTTHSYTAPIDSPGVRVEPG